MQHTLTPKTSHARFLPLLVMALCAVAVCACEQGGNGSSPEASQTSQAHNGFSRTQIRVVGSSTVYPFAAYVAEELGVTTDLRTPVVERTGTGGGMQIFCSGTGATTPDIVNASRPMTPSEWKKCQKHGVTDITEIMFGLDGIVLTQNAALPPLNLTLKQLTLALAAKVPKNGKLVKNPYEYWSQIDPSLPHREILIYGPPKSSGTRDAFEKLVMARATKHMAGYDGAYTVIRRDNAYVPAGENDNLIVQRVAQSEHAIGIVGHSFLAENRGLIEGVTINGVEPTPRTISSGKYPIARSLYFYVKNAHVGKAPGISKYVQLFLSDHMSGQHGVLTRLGLIPLPPEKRQQMRKRWEQRKQVTLESLKS